MAQKPSTTPRTRSPSGRSAPISAARRSENIGTVATVIARMPAGSFSIAM